MAETYTVEAQLIADINDYTSKLSQAARQMSGFESSTSASVDNIKKTISGIGKGMTIAGAAVTAMGVTALKGFGDFQQSLNQAAVIAGGTAKDIGGLADVANKMGADLPLSAKDAANAMVSMARDGASIKTIKEEFPAIAQAATAAGSDLQATASIVQQSMNLWGDSLKSPQRAAAILTQTANVSNASVEDMQQVLADVGGTATSVGYSMQDVSTAVGLLTNKGIPAAQAAQNLNNAITHMIKPSASAEGVMKNLGISYYDANGKMKPLNQVASELSKSMAGLTDEQKQLNLSVLFGQTGYKVMNGLMGAVNDKTGSATTSWKGMSKAINDASADGATATKFLSDQASEMQKNIGSKIEQVGGNWESLTNKSLDAKGGVTGSLLDMTNSTLNWAAASKSPFAEITRSFIGLSPVIGPVVTAIGGFLINASKITSTLSSAGQAVTNFASGISAAGGLVNWIKQTKLWTAATRVATAVQTAFTAAQSAGLLPWIALVAIIAAVVGALVYWITQTKSGQATWQAFTTWLSNAWSGMVGFFKGIWNGIASGVTAAVSFISSAWNASISGIRSAWSGVVSFFTTLWASITSGASIAWQGILTFVKPIVTAIVSLWNNLVTTLSGIWNGIVTIAAGIWGLVKAAVMGPILILIDLLFGNWSQMASDAELIWNSIVSSVGQIVNGLVQIVSSYINGLANLLSSIWNGIASVVSFVWNGIVSFISTMWNNLVSIVSNAANAIKNAVVNTWNALPGIASGIWNGLKSAVSNILSSLIGAVSSLGSSIVSSLSGAWSGLTGMVSGIWNGVKSAIHSAMNIDLGAAGRAIMNSFLHGLTSAWGAVKSFVGGIADWIRDHKGPISYDRKLLIPAGGAIMGGLNDGLSKGFTGVMSNVSSMAGNIANAVSGSADYRINAVSSGLNIGTDGTLSVDMTRQQQPATINLSMGGSTYRGFVDDISTQQGQTATLNRASIV